MPQTLTVHSLLHLVQGRIRQPRQTVRHIIVRLLHVRQRHVRERLRQIVRIVRRQFLRVQVEVLHQLVVVEIEETADAGDAVEVVLLDGDGGAGGRGHVPLLLHFYVRLVGRGEAARWRGVGAHRGEVLG